MKKTTFLIAGILLISYAASSQSRMGLKAGLNLANQLKTISIPQVPTTTQNTSTFVGYQFGVFYKTKLSRDLTLAAETNFSVLGSGMTLIASDGKSYETNEKLGYLELPITLQYTIKKVHFGLGPGFGFKMFSKLTNFENRNYDIAYYQTIDVAGNVLAGYTLSGRLDVNVRYSHGFVNIHKDAGYAETKNRFLNLSFLYYLK